MEIPHKFWKEYESADMLSREKKIKYIAKMIDDMHSIKDKKIRQHALKTLLTGYFDDLIEYKNLDK